MNWNRPTLGILPLLVYASHAAPDVQEIGRTDRARPAECSLVFSPVTTPLRDTPGNRYFVDQPFVSQLQNGEVWMGSGVTRWPPTGTASPLAPGLRLVIPPKLAGILRLPTGEMTPIGRPAFAGQMHEPALVDRTDKLMHVVWGARIDTTSDDFITSVHSVSYSSFDGSKWSAPELVMSGSALRWMPSEFAVLADGARMYAAVANNPRGDAPSQALVARREGGTWKQSVAAESKGWLDILKTRLQSGGKNSLVLLYSGFRSAPDSTYAAIFISRSGDGGATWNHPQVLRALTPRDQPMMGGFHRLGDGSLHLFWAAEPESGGATVVSHDVSHDGGITWDRTQHIAALRAFDYLLSAQVGDRIVLTVRDNNGQLAQALVGDTSGFHALSATRAAGLPVNIVRSDRTLETTWTLPTSVTTANYVSFGYTAVLHSVTTSIRCSQ